MGAPSRPAMPTPKDQERSVHQSTRLQILDDDWDDVIKEWLEQHIDQERLKIWGIPDTSANPLADLCRQLSTPGLYGREPDLRHGESTAAGLVRLMASAGLWTRMQHVQFLTLGLGETLLNIDAPKGEGGLVYRVVHPHNTWVRVAPDDPMRVVEIRELRLRWWDQKKEWVYTWDVRQIDGEPRWSIHYAERDGALGGDLSNVFLSAGKALAGDAYPYRYEDGSPFIPYVCYHEADTGKFWNHWSKRGIHRGTLHTALLWTYVMHCARDATGSFTLVAGLVPPSGTHIAKDVSNQGAGLRTFVVTPGAMAFCEFSGDGQQPFVHDVGPGANLPEVFKAAVEYELRQGVRFGLNPSDVSRQHANPMSAAALVVSNQGKREFASRVTPLFRRADLETIRKSAAIARVAGLGVFPETGYSVTYEEIPRSPQERVARREEITWEQESGLASPIDAYRELHPGTTEDDAVAALIKAQIDRMRIARDTRSHADALGLEVSGEDPRIGEITSAIDLARAVTRGEVAAPAARAIARMQLGLPDEVVEAIASSPVTQVPATAE